EPEPEPVPIRLVAEPRDARIEIAGGRAGRGSLEVEVPPGTTLRVVATRPGFAPIRRTITADSGGRTYTLNLEPQPIESVVPISRGPLVRGLAAAGDIVVGADSAGELGAANSRGSRTWTVGSANSGNENSEPVSAGGRIYFSGVSELIAVNPASGEVTGRRSLANTESHLFGRQVAYGNGMVYFPTDEEILLLDPESLSRKGSIVIPGGSKMSPGVSGNNLIIADQQGTVMILDAREGEVEHSIPTGAAQPVAIAPVIEGDRAVVVGRRGMVVAVSIETGSLLWETQLTGDAERGVFTNPVSDGERVYVHARETLYALTLADGSEAYGPFEDAAAAPLVKEGRIFYGALSGELIVRESAGGGVTARLDMPSLPRTRPLDLGERIAIGTQKGEVIYIHPGGIR
ncbi:MAG: PQQ-binding-like beta-propeller repeat protein, partial [Spirochaetaceae bacterium]